MQNNLHDASRHLSHSVKGHEHLLWVDAVCINQNDIEETTSHVKAVKSIHKQAGVIFAWLGLTTDEKTIESAYDLMRQYIQHVNHGLEKEDGNTDAVLASIDHSHPVFPLNDASETWRAWM